MLNHLFILKTKSKLFEIIQTSEPDLSNLDPTQRSLVTVKKVSSEFFELKVDQDFNNVLAEKLIISLKDKKDKIEFALKARMHIKHQSENLSLSQRGEDFLVPQLCFNFEEGLELAEPEIYLEANGWNLLNYSTILTNEEFTVDKHSKQYIVDIEG